MNHVNTRRKHAWHGGRVGSNEHANMSMSSTQFLGARAPLGLVHVKVKVKVKVKAKKFQSSKNLIDVVRYC